MQPTILAPASGFSPWALFLKEIRADMSVADKVRGSSDHIKDQIKKDWWAALDTKIRPF